MKKKILLLGWILTFPTGLCSQTWQSLPSPPAGSIRSLAVSSKGILFAGSTAGTYKSIDKGTRWTPIGLDTKVIDHLYVTNKGTLLAGTYRAGLYRSTDVGKSWTCVGFASNVYIFGIVSIPNNHIFISVAFTSDSALTGVFVSSDDGITWAQTGLAREDIFSLSATADNVLFAGSRLSLFRSTNEGKDWTLCGQGLPDSVPISTVIKINEVLLAASGNRQDASGQGGDGVFCSTNNGLSWVRSDSGMLPHTKVNSLCKRGDTILAATGHFGEGSMGVFRSTDTGRSWVVVALPQLIVRTVMVTSSGLIVAGTEGKGLYISLDGGNLWYQSGHGIENWETYKIHASPDGNLFVAASYGLWRLGPDRTEWKLVFESYFPNFAFDGGERIYLIDNRNSVFYSVNSGDTWTEVGEIPSPSYVRKFLVSNDSLLIAAGKGGVHISRDGGQTWNRYNVPGTTREILACILTSAGSLLVGTGDGAIYRSTDDGVRWELVGDSVGVFEFTIGVNDKIFAGLYAEGLYSSTDDGVTWRRINEGIRKGNSYISIMSVLLLPGGILVCGSLGEGVFQSSDDGEQWRPINEKLLNRNVWSLSHDSNATLYAATGKGIFSAHVGSPKR